MQPGSVVLVASLMQLFFIMVKWSYAGALTFTKEDSVASASILHGRLSNMYTFILIPKTRLKWFSFWTLASPSTISLECNLVDIGRETTTPMAFAPDKFTFATSLSGGTIGDVLIC